MPEPESTISDGSDDAEVESEIMQVGNTNLVSKLQP